MEHELDAERPSVANGFFRAFVAVMIGALSLISGAPGQALVTGVAADTIVDDGSLLAQSAEAPARRQQQRRRRVSVGVRRLRSLLAGVRREWVLWFPRFEPAPATLRRGPPALM